MADGSNFTGNSRQDAAMESIKTVLKERNIYLPLRYYGADDLSVGWEIRSIAENRDLFESLYSRYPLDSVRDLDTYYYYLLTKKIFSMWELVYLSVVKYPERKSADLLAELAHDAEIVLSKTTDSAIEYINEHVEDIFSDEQTDSELKYISVDFIIEFQEDVKYSVFEYLCRNFSQLIIKRYGELRETFIKYQKLFTVLFPSGHLDLKSSFGLQDVLGVWRHEYKTKDSPFKPVLDRYVDELCRDVDRTLSEQLPGESSILQTEPVVKAVSLFLRQINSKYEKKFWELAKDADYRVLQYLSAPQHFHNFKIPEGDAELRMWKSIDPCKNELTDLTHQIVFGSTDITYESFLEKSPGGHTAKSVNDSISGKREEYLLMLSDVNGVNFLEILNNSATFCDYKKKTMSEIQFVSGSECLSDDSLKDDVSVMFCALSIVVRWRDNRNYEESEVVCYGASMFICALTEKLLRLFYMRNPPKNSGNINQDKLTLTNLLMLKDMSPITNSFKFEHRRGIAYFLMTLLSGEGRNFRNKLAHWESDMSPGLMSPFFTSRLLWLFTDVLNSVYLYYEPVNGSQADSESGK